MKRYILEPQPVSDRCFLLQALYWAAFYKYPTGEIDILSDNIEDIMLEVSYNDIYEPISKDYELMFTPEFCVSHGLPINPRVEAILNNKPTYYEDEYYVDMLKYSVSDEDTERLKKEQKEALEYNKNLENFNDKLEEYLEIFEAQLFVFLKSGKIKTYAFRENIEYIYSEETKKQFDDDFFKKCYPNIKEGDDFSINDEYWYEKKPILIDKEHWRINNIDWDACSLEYNEQVYVYIQLDVEDLFKCFPEPHSEYKQVKYVSGNYILDSDDNRCSIVRGRKPKMNYDSIIHDFITNIDRYRGQKLESVVAEFMNKYPNIGRTTLIGKLNPLLKACSQK